MITVNLSRGLEHSELPGTLVDAGLILSIENQSTIAVSLTSFRLALPDGNQLYNILQMKERLPHLLGVGERFTAFFSKESVVLMLNKQGYSGTIYLTGVYEDVNSNEYRSSAFAFKVDD